MLPGSYQVIHNRQEQGAVMLGTALRRINLCFQLQEIALRLNARSQAEFAVRIQQVDLPNFFQV